MYKNYFKKFIARTNVYLSSSKCSKVVRVADPLIRFAIRFVMFTEIRKKDAEKNLNRRMNIFFTMFERNKLSTASHARYSYEKTGEIIVFELVLNRALFYP